ncbi:MAG: thioredoxin domain-containing protein [Roseburia sp.]|nr:thioredoxin domain-containing protein [Roseburia sp.]MCM1277372.1 thioredoxin domain-containing protein [Robinsoniella sp.]
MSNRLKNEKSPYLLQHGDNPVDWYPWCEEAFKKAEREDKPVFLSIGYSTCHWCHVMAHESFEDEEISRLLNENFVCIKVDREERPDIDAVYMSVCQAVTGSGGWPLTIIMTPKQKPFFAGTYFPKQNRYGQPGLLDILTSVSDLWKEEREELQVTGAEIAAVICERRLPVKKEPEKDILKKAYVQFKRQFDGSWGGFGSAPKFPAPHNLLFLMEYALMENVPDAERMAEETLNAIAKGGIHDHIGGGFSRYSTDEKWLIPHFEKMLYDNGLLILAYLKAYQITGKEDYEKIVCSTADYILRELTDEKGGFYCGQDADSDGVEGKYYSFTPKEVLSVLGKEDGEEFCRLYGIAQGGNFEGKSIPNRIGQAHIGWQADDMRLRKLYDYRMKRTKLHKDKKCLLSWNAWTILALARTGWILSKERYLNGAFEGEAFIKEHMKDEKGRLYLRFCEGEAAHQAQLEDYGVYALAMLELYRISFRVEYLKEAVWLAEYMIEFFEDEKGGYYMTAKDAEQLILRPKEAYDGAIPSGNSVVAVVLQELAALTGETKWQEAAWRQLVFLAGEIEEYPAGHSFALLAMLKAFSPKKELICVVNGKMPQEMMESLKEKPQDEWHVLVKNAENAEILSECAPFTKNYPIPESGAVYYLCENGVCRAPVTDFKQLGL